jgi:hypothetical protein
MLVIGRVAGSTFRLVSDQVSAAIIAQAEGWSQEAKDARDVAVAAASSVQSEQVSKAHAEANYHPAVAPDFIRTAGYAIAADGGGALYKKVAGEPPHPGKLPVTLGDGVTVAWYELIGDVSPSVFGADRTGGTLSDASLAEWISYCKATGSALLVPAGDRYKTGTSLVLDFKWEMYGGGTITAFDLNDGLFKVTSNVDFAKTRDVVLEADFSNAGVDGSISSAFRFTSDVTFFQWAKFSNIELRGFRIGFYNQCSPHETGFGQEGGINWCTFDNITLHTHTRYNKYGFYHENGSGTGNSYLNINGMIGGPGDPGFVHSFNGVGCVVGDLLIDGGHWGSYSNNGIFMQVSAGTVYRSRWRVAGIQLDAGMTALFELDASTGVVPFAQLDLSGIVFGGAASIGTMPPIAASRVVGTDASSWEEGRFINTDSTGSVNIARFSVDLAPNSFAVVEHICGGYVGGVGAGVSQQRYLLRSDGATAYVIPLGQASNPAAPIFTLNWGVVGTQVSFGASMSPSAPGTVIAPQIKVTGGSIKVSKL